MEAKMEEKHVWKRVALLLGLALLALGLVLSFQLRAQHPYEPIAALLRARGYTVQAGDLYSAGSFAGQSISQALQGVDVREAVEASERGGFPSDANAVGDLTLLLCALQNKDVITLFVRDDGVELGFIQSITTGEIKPIEGDSAP
ncbi:MAG: hypothetical protein LBN26_08160 [Christensenellaceae bacterium]|jgi:hypothetical protein|nr:hypothetical protein [Christensenellaceae bacterium]